MNVITLNFNSGFKFLSLGIFVLFISFLFLPGYMKAGETPSPFPFIIFISGSVISVFGLLKIVGSIAKKFLNLEVKKDA